jgi:hypothetical protein
MTIAIRLATVASSIAAIKISGVTVRDIEQIPEDASKSLPILYPKPDGYISNMVFERLSFGGGGAAAMSISYTLTYRYLHAIAGARLGLFSVYADMVANIAKILVAILDNDDITGALDMVLEGVSNIGPLTDPAGQITYHGVDITLRVTELVQ